MKSTADLHSMFVGLRDVLKAHADAYPLVLAVQAGLEVDFNTYELVGSYWTVWSNTLWLALPAYCMDHWHRVDRETPIVAATILFRELYTRHLATKFIERGKSSVYKRFLYRVTYSVCSSPDCDCAVVRAMEWDSEKTEVIWPGSVEPTWSFYTAKLAKIQEDEQAKMSDEQAFISNN